MGNFFWNFPRKSPQFSEYFPANQESIPDVLSFVEGESLSLSGDIFPGRSGANLLISSQFYDMMSKRNPAVTSRPPSAKEEMEGKSLGLYA